MNFTANSVGPQTGKVFVITGANSGIGFETARVLCRKGGRVVMACRDANKMAEAARLIKAETSSATVLQVVCDLGDLSSIRAAAAALAERVPHIDVLINNAGVMAIPERVTKDGFEMQFGTNHLGHFALTGLLLPLLTKAPQGRVVTTSSILHKKGELILADIPKPAHYDRHKAYAMSKLANVLFTHELNRRLLAVGANVRAITSHPGYSATNLQGVGPAMEGSAFMGVVMRLANALVAQSAAMGALGTLCAALSPDLKGGEYVGSTGMGGLRGYPQVAKSSPASYDEAMAQKLWERSEELTQVHFAFGAAA